ncbi:MAG: ABC transporter permease subunit [Geminicoccaceae bacterium]
MTAGRLAVRLGIALYLLLFFAYLLGPLVIMSITAFNSSSFPRIWPWECLTFEWFAKLVADRRLMDGLQNSVLIGVLVVLLSVTLGLAGSLLLTQIWPRARTAYYTLITAPILMPGVVIGISTVLFWDRVATAFGGEYGGPLYDGIFLTTMGQSCFIAAYCMLVFVARLQRFDSALLEAALDLGASNVQAFRKILLPYLQPAIASAAIIAFLASFENYNTSVFTLSHYTSFTVEVAQKVRLGIDPSVSALAVIVIGLTLFAALLREAYGAAGRAGGRPGRLAAIAGSPAAVLATLMLLGVAATVGFAMRHDPAACKASALEQRLERQRQFAPQPSTTPAAPPAVNAPAAAPRSGQPGGFGNMFSPENLTPAQPPR